MATAKNITMKQFNGTDYDTLYPKTIAEQVDGIYSKDEVLSNGTKALYGLTDSAVPDDVFALIAAQNINKIVIEKIVTSKNWVAPKAVGQLFKVYACGGGGGGGGGGNNSSYRQYGGGGGGSGYVRIGTFSIPNGESVSVVCGAGGSGGTETGDGSRGGTTQFGTYLSAEGGYGGQGVTSDSGTNGGNGGAGGGAGRSGQAGGNGDIYGGGGGASGNIGASGGNGGTYGGGGGGYTPGTGGEHGTNGTSLQSSTIDAPYSFTDPLINILLRTDLLNQPLSARTGFYLGGNGYGSIGGYGSQSYNSGGGGGYCGNGGNGQASYGGCGGAGNYCGNGGNSKSYGGGGGGGLFANGGDSSDPSNQYYVGGGGGAGIIDGVTSTVSTQGGNGGSGGCYIVYVKGE